MTEQFIRDRRYLKAVSPKTIIWYTTSFKAFEGALHSKAAVSERIVQLRERGVSPISINTYVRCLNAYFMWLHREHGRDFLKIPTLQEEQKVIATLIQEQVTRLLTF